MRTYACDMCKENCKYFFHFNDVLVSRSNGKTKGKPMGFQEVEMKELTFCSIICLSEWLETRADPSNFGWRGDYYLPGEQVGVEDCKGNKIGK